MKIISVLQIEVAVPYQFCDCGDLTSCCLTVYFIQPDNRYYFARNHLAQYSARTYRRQLIGITDKNQLCAGSDRTKQISCQIDIQHGNLIHQNQISVQRFRFAVFTILIGK